MPREVEYILNGGGIEDVYSFEYDDPDKRHHAYRIFRDRKIIHFFLHLCLIMNIGDV